MKREEIQQAAAERKQFEAWWKETWGTEGQRTLKRGPHGNYTGVLATWAWLGWQHRAMLSPSGGGG